MDPQRRTALLTACTPASIAEARAQRDFEREMIYRETGVRITDAIIVAPRAVIMLCPKAGCTHAASAKTEGRATRGIAAHLVSVHGVKES